MIKRILQVSVPLLLLAAPLSGCGSDNGSNTGSDSVTYTLVATGDRDMNGKGSGKVEYTDSSGKKTTTHVDLPWKVDVTVKPGTKVDFAVWPEPAGHQVAGMDMPYRVSCQVLVGTEATHTSPLQEVGADCTFTA